MPRKKTDNGKLMNAQGEELRTVRLDLSATVHKKLRVAAAEEEISMAQMARQYVEQALGVAKPKEKKK
jgi:hypothetical protein